MTKGHSQMPKYLVMDSEKKRVYNTVKDSGIGLTIDGIFEVTCRELHRCQINKYLFDLTKRGLLVKTAKPIVKSRKGGLCHIYAVNWALIHKAVDEYKKTQNREYYNHMYGNLRKQVLKLILESDRGSCFYTTKIGKKKTGRSKFQDVLEEMGIKHSVARAHHPQTNGKIERWFGTYKREFNERFKSIDEYIRYYNYERPHQRLGYKTPAQVFFKKEGVQHFQIARFADEKKKE